MSSRMYREHPHRGCVGRQPTSLVIGVEGGPLDGVVILQGEDVLSLKRD
jgi:hypothetical protein